MKFIYAILFIRIIMLAFTKATKKQITNDENGNNVKDPAAFEIR